MTKSEALETSILQWQENVKAERSCDVLIGEKDCAICAEFYSLECEGCPVYLRTGEGFCVGSPYGAAYTAWISWKYTNPNSDGDTLLAARDEFRKAAQAEVDFLISLRETE